MPTTERVEREHPVPPSRPVNDNRRSPPMCVRSWFPADALARICKPGRSVMTSAPARGAQWQLTFERRTAPFTDPLMGWTGGDDPLTQVRLSFPTREAAIAYAERQGLTYVLDPSHPSLSEADAARRPAHLRLASPSSEPMAKRTNGLGSRRQESCCVDLYRRHGKGGVAC
jgi:hypothetical protein